MRRCVQRLQNQCFLHLVAFGEVLLFRKENYFHEFETRFAVLSPSEVVIFGAPLINLLKRLNCMYSGLRKNFEVVSQHKRNMHPSFAFEHFQPNCSQLDNYRLQVKHSMFVRRHLFENFFPNSRISSANQGLYSTVRTLESHFLFWQYLLRLLFFYSKLWGEILGKSSTDT